MLNPSHYNYDKYYKFTSQQKKQVLNFSYRQLKSVHSMYDCILSGEQLLENQLYRVYSLCLGGYGTGKSGSNMKSHLTAT